MPKVIDLFCGCGGLSCGFAAEGFDIQLGADIRDTALKTFARNFPGAKALRADLAVYRPEEILRNLHLQPEEIDCLIGGPPCQGFSKNVPASQRSLEDPKNLLIVRFLDFVRVLKPKIVLIENVAEMKNAFGQAYADEITRRLETLGFSVTSIRLNSADYGVPQLRRRAFFFANRLGIHLGVPEPTHLSEAAPMDLFHYRVPKRYVTVRDAISDLPPLEAGAGVSPIPYPQPAETEYQRDVREGSPMLHDHVARPLSKAQLDRVRHLAPDGGEGVEALPDHLRPRMGYSGAYARLRWDEQARTITRWVFHPGSGRFYHPHDYRVITIREAARLQSFPDLFVFEGTYVQKASQVGEAVPPLVARAFAREARRALDDGSNRLRSVV